MKRATSLSPVSQKSRQQGVRLSNSERAQISDIIEAANETKVADQLWIAKTTLARAVAGLPLQRSTAICIRSRLAAILSDKGGAP